LKPLCTMLRKDYQAAAHLIWLAICNKYRSGLREPGDPVTWPPWFYRNPEIYDEKQTL
jgi:hypothetical protein